MRLALVITTVLVAGCNGVAVPTPPTPIVVYVTPAPTPIMIYVTPPPTPQPTPVSATTTPDLGVSWMAYLSWSVDTTNEWQDLLSGPTNTISQIRHLGEQGVDLARSDMTWLRTHQPQACYAALYEEHIKMTDVRLRAMQAVADLDLDAADLMDDIITENGIYNVMLDQTTC